jgi:glycosidase
MELRQIETTLRGGEATILHHDPENKMVIFERRTEEDQILVILNRSDAEQTVDLSEWTNHERLVDLLSEKDHPVSEVKINPVSALILK